MLAWVFPAEERVAGGSEDRRSPLAAPLALVFFGALVERPAPGEREPYDVWDH